MSNINGFINSKSTKTENNESTITRLTFSGGGARGGAYGGCLAALMDANVLEGVKAVSGSSAGAIIAVFIATGVSPDKIKAFVQNDFNQLLGKPDRHSIGSSLISKDGNLLLEKITETILQSIEHYRDNNFNKLSSAQFHFLNQIVAERQLTFNDLMCLHLLDSATFKQLTVLVTQFSNGTPQVCNTRETPELSIAEAVRASAALPVFITPYPLTIKGKRSLYRDGGYYDNLPANYFDYDEQKQAYTNYKPLKTLLFVFGDRDRNSTSYKALYKHYVHYDNLVRAINYSFDRAVKANANKQSGLRKESSSSVNSFYHNFKLNFLSLNSEHFILTESEFKKLNKLFINVFNQYSAPLQSNQLDIVRLQLIKKIDKAFPESIYQVGLAEKIIRDKIPHWLTGSKKGTYTNTGQKKLSWRLVNEYYSHRTVILNIGKIGTSSFSKASRCVVILEALAYLDTMLYFRNYNIGCSGNSNQHRKYFFRDFVTQFQTKDPDLFRRITNCCEPEFIEQFYAIKHYAEKHLESRASLVLIDVLAALKSAENFKKLSPRGLFFSRSVDGLSDLLVEDNAPQRRSSV